MVSILNKRSPDHLNWCEDNYFIYENDKIIVGAVLDGCSTGKDSHWASKTLALVFDSLKPLWNNFEIFENPDINPIYYIDKIIADCSNSLSEISTTLKLPFDNFLSTIVFFVYHKETKQLAVKFFGDGAFFYKTDEVDGEYIMVENDEKNMPLYLGYYFKNENNNLTRYIETRNCYILENVVDFSICSDGIFSFKHHPLLNKNQEDELKNPIDFLIKDKFLQNLKAGLSRKFNMLTKQGYVIEDDLTVMRYINEI